jgi:hypothetical protein
MPDNLRDEMKAGFKKADNEFEKIDSQFKKIDNEFVAVRAEFVAVRAEMTAGFKNVDERFKQVDDQIKVEGETTRRYFDIVAEQFKEYVKVLADGTARNTERLDGHEKRLDDHDKRLMVLEQPPG